MLKKANEFLELSGRLYESNKIKWKKMFPTFDEDVYNDTILKVYDAILKGEDTESDLNGYWFKSFKNNLNRNKDYQKNICDDDIIDIKEIYEKELEEKDINIYYSTISAILFKVRHQFSRKTFEIFRMYLLCNMSYDELDRLTGVDSKERIMKVRQWLNDSKNIK